MVCGLDVWDAACCTKEKLTVIQTFERLLTAGGERVLLQIEEAHCFVSALFFVGLSEAARSAGFPILCGRG